jgi:hypothetical protein
MFAIQIGNAYWQLCETLYGRIAFILLDCKALSTDCVVCNFSKTDFARLFYLVFLGGNDYTWAIVCMDFVPDLTKSSEFHFTITNDSCLLYDMAHFISCHKKSPLAKQ